MILEVSNTMARVKHASIEEREWLRNYLSFPDSKARFRQSGDGRVRMYNIVLDEFPAGLVALVRHAAPKEGFTVEVFDKTTPVPPDPDADLAWLRPDQLEAIQKALNKKRGILHLPTSYGKGEIAVALARAVPAEWLFLVHRSTLADDIATRFMARNAAHGVDLGQVGRIYTGEWSEGVRLTCATFQSLAAALKKGDSRARALLQRCEGLIVDECFPAGTKVGGVPIEQVRVGDLVPSFDPAGVTAPTLRRVARLWVRRPSAMVRVIFADREVACTPNHRFWTSVGWVAAAELTSGMSVLRLSREEDISLRTVQHPGRDRDNPHNVHPLLRPLSRGAACRTSQGGDSYLCNVQHAIQPNWSPGVGTGQTTPDLLLEGVPIGSFVEKRNTHEYSARRDSSRADAQSQPNLDAGCEREDCYNKESKWQLETSTPRVSHTQTNGTAGAPLERAWGRVGDGSLRETGSGAVWLQSGHSQQGDENRSRTGWEQPLRRAEIEGSSAGHRSAWARVDRVEVLELGCDGTFGGVCPDGLVYNLEVEGIHTYFAEGIGVSNCHVAPADSYYGVAMMTTKAAYRIGLSGTPLDRGDRRSVLAIASLGPVIYRMGSQEVIARGDAAKPHIRMVEVDHSVGKAGETAALLSHGVTYQGVYGNLVVRGKKRNAALIEIAKVAEKPGLLFVKEVRHGRLLEKALLAAGIRAGFVWGNHSPDYRKTMINRLVRGDLDILICSIIFQEGIDIPCLRSTINGVGGASVIAALQRLGRGMRVERNAAGEVIKFTFEMWDIFDKGQEWLENHSRIRRRAYMKEGHEVEVSTSAK